jgi:hypothetical protein
MKPAIDLKIDVFPHPDGPNSVTISPSPMDKSTPLTAWKSS